MQAEENANVVGANEDEDPSPDGPDLKVRLFAILYMKFKHFYFYLPPIIELYVQYFNSPDSDEFHCIFLKSGWVCKRQPWACL